jgi:hypothetical protein
MRNPAKRSEINLLLVLVFGVRRRPLLFAMAAVLASCGAREINLDGTYNDGGSTNPNSSPDAIAPGVSIVVEDQETAMKIAVDDQRIYWYSALPRSWGEAKPIVYARVRSCLKSDCPSTITTYDSTTFDWNVPRIPGDYYGLSAAGDSVYWVRGADASVGMSILSCPSAGCVGAPRVIASSVRLSSMAVDESHVYWTSWDDTAVLRLPLAGGGTPQAIALNTTAADQIALSGSHVYWIEQAGQANASIKRVPKDGSAPATILAAGQNHAATLAVDSDFAYWGNSFSVGSLARCPLTGCTADPTVLIANQNLPRALVVDGKSIFWMTVIGTFQIDEMRAAVMRCPVDGCEAAAETLAVQLFSEQGMSMAVDVSHVYWVAQGLVDPVGDGFFPHATIYRHMK